jgi:hypothetical protein
MIYLINAETKEVVNTYNNVIAWGSNFVEYTQNGLRAKIYCNDNEYFTDTLEEQDGSEND